ncbi:winged helix DNA-binding domain-containing protein [Algoriphagus lacus]|uniref:Winged helix DNA-binding domain-containing protein n=1 Tax=Algoriphagus lacus TaxID=2056311 RepID=A0A418PPV0_9BACT|nr:winged helix DNA-binding domain-containing protein [Algoriphagus lacus]RIW14106.1 winged helix DNA-binding domain-containing protein [Algoriphagus lacus]
MKVKELIQLRLANQGLTSAEVSTWAADVVSHFGAMQAQDYPMAKWAVGMRMQQASDKDIEMCVNSGEIIRTHILRPTWHFVSRKDIRWMMELSAPYVKIKSQYVNKQVGLTDEIFKKVWKMIEVELANDHNLTKEDLTERLLKKKIKVEGLLATQLLIRAELEMRICSGVRKANKITYALFESRVPNSEKLSKKDSLVKLASIYFKSRGPATIKDFMWWSGLNMTDAKYGVSGLGENLISASIDGVRYLYFESDSFPKKQVSALLPSFDEYMVGYSESRGIAFPPDIEKSFLGNGIFKPIVLSDNTIVGTWKRVDREPFVEIQFLEDHRKYSGVNISQQRFKSFSGKAEEENHK